MKMTVKSFKEIINESRIYEAKTDKLLIDGYNNLWVTYAAGSGTAEPNFDYTKSYITDKPGDSNSNPTLVKKITKITDGMKPIKSKKNSSLYSIPVYSGKEPTNFDIWGGSEKPKKDAFFIVDKGKIIVITFFGSKNEAMSWINSLS